MTKRLNMITAMVFALSATASLGQTALAEPPVTAPAAVANFTLVDQTGASHELYAAVDAPAIVIATQVNGDPLSRENIKTLEGLKSVFGQATFLLLNASPTDTRSTIATEAANLNTTLPILDDDQQSVAKSLGVTQTGEAIVIDPIGWKIVYRGPIDAAAAKDPNAQFLLFNALVYVMSHRAIEETVVGVKGTPISFPAHGNPAGS